MKNIKVGRFNLFIPFRHPLVFNVNTVLKSTCRNVFAKVRFLKTLPSVALAKMTNAFVNLRIMPWKKIHTILAAAFAMIVELSYCSGESGVHL